MAAKTTAKVATLTGAAKDDLFGGVTEDSLVSNLAVLANDPGAARLWSLDQGVPSLSGAAQVGLNLSAAHLLSGAWISANSDGTIHYDASAMNLQSLAEGESFTDTFIYTARMANGALSTATVSVQIAGVNDAPMLIAPTTKTITDTPQAEEQSSVGGTLVGSDVDHGAVLTYSLAGGSSDYGSIVVNADGTWSFTDVPAMLDALGGGQTAAATFQAIVTDEHGASSAAVDIVVNLIGVNDIADVTGDNSGSVTEDGTLVVSGDLNVADRDAGESAFGAVGALAGTFGDFLFDANTGAWSYTLRNGDANVQALNGTDVVHDTLKVWSQDNSDSIDITVTINGANEPVVDDEGDGEGGGRSNFMFNFGAWQSDHNVFRHFTPGDTLRYAQDLTPVSVSYAYVDSDSKLDAIVSFSYNGSAPAPSTINAILIGVNFEPHLEATGHP
jgi:VCBS repeat-containing protein